MSKSPVNRRGLSLVEVVLAMAILAASMVTLSQLVNLGLRSAGEARDLTRGQLLAETVMSEIAAGITPADSVQQVALDMEPGWLVSIDVAPAMQNGILQVVVITERDTESENAARFELSRWIRDPSIPLPTDDESLEEQATSSSSAANSSAGPSSSGNQGGGP